MSEYGNDLNGNLIDLKRVDKTFENAAGKFIALQDVNLKVKRGEFVAIVGKSGSGKSTLLNIITGIDRPTAGEVMVAGEAIGKLSEGQIAVWRGQAIGVVFQFFQLLPALTAIENVMLPMDFCRKVQAGERYERAWQLLQQVGMAEQAGALPMALSGGQQQSVAIARALANDSPLLAADEPTGNLDSRTAAAVFSLFERLVDAGKTILMVTHDRDLARRARRAIVLADGRIVDEVIQYS